MVKMQNLAWEPALSDSAYLNYAKKSGSQLIPKNAARTFKMLLFRKWHWTTTPCSLLTFTSCLPTASGISSKWKFGGCAGSSAVREKLVVWRTVVARWSRSTMLLYAGPG